MGAKASNGCATRQIRMSGSMSGVWKRSQVRTSEAPPDERGGKQICSGYSYRATSRLYQLRAIAVRAHPAGSEPTRSSAAIGRRAPIPDLRETNDRTAAVDPEPTFGMTNRHGRMIDVGCSISCVSPAALGCDRLGSADRRRPRCSVGLNCRRADLAARGSGCQPVTARGYWLAAHPGLKEVSQ